MSLLIDRSGLSKRVIGQAITLHKSLGPGLLEDTYEQCLAYELREIGLTVRTQVTLPLKYKNLEIPFAYRADLIVDEQLIIELKTVQRITDLHVSQLLTYLKISGVSVGLLMNFNSRVLRHDIRRVLNPRLKAPS
jgi:GxxExxY protein